MKKFKYNKETGRLEVWENGKKIGVINTIGDDVKKTKGKKNAGT